MLKIFRLRKIKDKDSAQHDSKGRSLQERIEAEAPSRETCELGDNVVKHIEQYQACQSPEV